MIDQEQQSSNLEDQVLEIYTQPARFVPLPAMLLCCLASYYVRNEVSPYIWGSWICLTGVFLFLRFRILTSLPSIKRFTTSQKISIATGLSVTNGILHSFSVATFPFVGISEQALLTLILLGMVTGAISTTTGYKPIYLSYALPVIGSTIFGWLLDTDLSLDYVSYIAIVFLLSLYLYSLYSTSQNYFHQFSDSFEIREQLAQLNLKLQQALEQAILSNESKTRFLAAASHDLRQPIHALSLLSAALSMRKLDEDSHAIAQHIDASIQNLSSQMIGLLDISKLDAGLIEYVESNFDLVPLLNHLCAEYEQIANGKNIRLIFQCSDQKAMTRTDSDLLERVFRNLLSNAVKYTDDGVVTVSLGHVENCWRVSISDTGRGIKDEEKKKIFEEFYQIDNINRDRKKGLGLGLAIVERLTRILEIPLKFESEFGAGTIFSIDLPAQSQGEVSQVAPLERPQLNGLRVLCIDDEEDIRTALSILLSSLGCIPDLAANISESLELASSSKPDILLADLRLAGNENGIGAADEIRKLYPNLPVLLISGDTDPKVLRESEKENLRMLHKPVDAETLAVEIMRAIEDATRRYQAS